MTVTTNCYCCLRTISVPVELFNDREVATCRDAGVMCRQAGDPQ
jgi:hypothetical protein